jgi:hypothetical protein
MRIGSGRYRDGVHPRDGELRQIVMHRRTGQVALKLAPPLRRAGHHPRQLTADRRGDQRCMEEPAALAVPDQADPHRPDLLHTPPPMAVI